MRMEQKSKRRGILKTHLPGLDISNDAAILESHGCDWTRFRTPAPSAVVFPRSVEEVVALVGWQRNIEFPWCRPVDARD